MAAIIGTTEVVVAHSFWANQHEELYRRTSPAINFIGHPTRSWLPGSLATTTPT